MPERSGDHHGQPATLQRIILRNFLVALLAIALAAWFTGLQTQRFLENHDRRVAADLARDKAELIAQHAVTYRRIVRNLAESRTVRDLLLVADTERSENWARRNRLLLPHAVGLALIDLDGQVLGNPPDLRVGAECLRDLKTFLERRESGRLPVHFGRRGLEHYDIAELVHDDLGEPIGLVFASFRITTLQLLLDRLGGHGVAIALHDADGRRLAAYDGREHMDAPVWRFDLLISETGWHAEILVQKTDPWPLLLGTGLTGALSFGLVALLMLVLQLRLERAMLHDQHALHQALARLRSGQEDSGEHDIRYHFSETRALVRALYAAMEEVRLQQHELAGLGLTDDLTGLPNRRNFNQRLPTYFELARQGTPVAVVLVDLDDFSQANDRLGHEHGDELLRLAAQVFRSNARETDFLARLGEDEFVFILLDIDAPFLHRWFARLNDAMLLAEAESLPELVNHPVTLSAGFAFMEPGKDKNPSHTLKRADLALKRAKDLGKGRIAGHG